jgi:carbon-monoxide dehydrogenase large subunit
METPTFVNPLGAKGHRRVGHDRFDAGRAVGGRRRTWPHLGVRHVDMPATPERVWRAINAVR